MNISQKVVFWDWNGTLLDDVDACVKSMNIIRSKRDMPEIQSDLYKSIFGFPVKDYYEQLGFDFSQTSFENLSTEFISNYNSNLESAKLQPYVYDVLKHFQSIGKQQVIISAMEHQMLLKQLEHFGVNSYFTEICGIDNIYAHSKAYLAHDYIKAKQLNPSDIVFIGDTLHDKEVGDEIGCSTILVANGHQNVQRLRVNGNVVINDLKTLLELT